MVNSIDYSVTQRIKLLMSIQNPPLSYRLLGKVLGKSTSRVSRLLAGDMVSYEIIEKLADYFHTTIEYLLLGEPNGKA